MTWDITGGGDGERLGVPAAVHHVLVLDQTPNAELTFSVVAVTSTPTTSDPGISDPVTVATLPEAPVVTSPAAGGPGEATVEWTALDPGAESGYADIVGYRACPIPVDAPCVEVAAGETTATLTDLGRSAERIPSELPPRARLTGARHRVEARGRHRLSRLRVVHPATLALRRRRE